MDAIHCYGDDVQEIDTTKEALPSIIVVGTCCDKLQIDKEIRKLEIQDQFDQILGDHPKRKHIKDFIMLSNTTSTESDFDVLRHRIVQLAAKVETWGQQLPTRWIKYEQALDQHRENQDRVMTYEDMKSLGELVGLDIKDRNEINLFLRYQHDIGNLIYFDDIPDLVILQPQWLVDMLKCLVSARKFQLQRNIVYNSDWKELETTGRLTEDLITEAFTGEEEGTGFLKYRRHILEIMEKFDIIVKPNMADDESVVGEDGEINKSKIPTVNYYVPCLIKSKPIRNIIDSFKIDGQDFQRTSWICMNFDFLPPAFFNHVLVNYIRRYQISLEPSKRGCRPALYRGMGVFNLDSSTKLAVCVSKQMILFQIWKWGKHSKVSFKCIWEHAESIITGIKGRYKMNVSYTVKMKCYNGSYDNPDGMVEMSKLETEEEYFCDEHAVLHKSKDLLDPWFKEELNAEMLNYVRLAKTVTDLMPEVMIEQLKSDRFELAGNTSMTFRSLFNSFQLQNRHKPTTGKWTSPMCPNEDTEIGVGDDVKRWRFILTELKNHSKISEESFVALEKVLANVFVRSEKLFEGYSFLTKYQRIKTEMFEANDYDYYLQKVKHDIIPDTFEINIRRHYQMIIQEISVSKILDQMMTHCVLSIEDRRHIEQHVKQTEQNKALLDIIIDRNRSIFNVFTDALRDSGYDGIAKILRCDLEDITVDTRTTQMEGNEIVYDLCGF
ncbi:neuralized pats1, partial [Mytilus galloprovincialis]